jgi:PIN domain nuclease of toxin-antitoxin system
VRYLLDTHVVLWLLGGFRGSVPDSVAAAIAEPSARPAVSAATVWEIATKRSLGKLRMGPDWLAALMRLDFESLPINAWHAAAVEGLNWHHRDPFDRILVAQATVEGMTLVTADRAMSAYDVPVLWG